MKITELKKISLIDYPSKISTILFTPKCNYKCPTCHAKQILQNKKELDEKAIFEYLDFARDFIDGVVICGGEPTREQGLKYFLRKLKDKGLAVKLDTNGSNYIRLGELKKEGLVKYVAMDVKGPMRLYAKLVGEDFTDERDEVVKAIEVVSQFPNYEFRTTVVPVTRSKGISFMTAREIGDTAKLIYESTGDDNHKYFLQGFIARSKDEMVDEKFAKENLPEKFWETPKKHLEDCLAEAKKYLPNAKIR
ncbi:MAG: anaerobic ribonucleoside-triphosphate reductase activating protein [Candidatus Nanoarchaeia archaeon]|nr:anaerobic ribonucleoside-triphosphate reductase activating protein [Candidatus Nanoarchaeia archaeon]MDD5357756.1 anaerobic ribonucleoside-triphosphate reductase activating protein [Candidatus Nanoarchaeia archaeon]MDD5588675.1 anaerobic ribonucleoside-triphosphate reductase activating protein [Candidatus Nanoarchaeia archaeon]